MISAAASLDNIIPLSVIDNPCYVSNVIGTIALRTFKDSQLNSSTYMLTNKMILLRRDRVLH